MVCKAFFILQFAIVKSIRTYKIKHMAINKTVEEVEPFVSVKVVAKTLDWDEHTIYVNAAKGKIPSYKIGKDVKFLMSEILAWRESKRRKTKQEIQNGVDAAIFSHQ